MYVCIYIHIHIQYIYIYTYIYIYIHTYIYIYIYISYWLNSSKNYSLFLQGIKDWPSAPRPLVNVSLRPSECIVDGQMLPLFLAGTAGPKWFHLTWRKSPFWKGKNMEKPQFWRDTIGTTIYKWEILQILSGRLERKTGMVSEKEVHVAVQCHALYRHVYSTPRHTHFVAEFQAVGFNGTIHVVFTCHHPQVISLFMGFQPSPAMVGIHRRIWRQLFGWWSRLMSGLAATKLLQGRSMACMAKLATVKLRSTEINWSCLV